MESPILFLPWPFTQFYLHPRPSAETCPILSGDRLQNRTKRVRSSSPDSSCAHASHRLESIQAMLLSLKPLSLHPGLLIAAVAVLLQVGSAQNNPATKNTTPKQDSIQGSTAPVTPPTV